MCQETPDEMFDRIIAVQKKFCRVRDRIDPVKHPIAYRLAFSRPLLFYKEHTEEEAIKLLIDEEERKLKGGE